VDVEFESRFSSRLALARIPLGEGWIARRPACRKLLHCGSGGPPHPSRHFL